MPPKNRQENREIMQILRNKDRHQQQNISGVKSILKSSICKAGNLELKCLYI